MHSRSLNSRKGLKPTYDWCLLSCIARAFVDITTRNENSLELPLFVKAGTLSGEHHVDEQLESYEAIADSRYRIAIDRLVAMWG